MLVVVAQHDGRLQLHHHAQIHRCVGDGGQRVPPQREDAGVQRLRLVEDKALLEEEAAVLPDTQRLRMQDGRGGGGANASGKIR